MPDVAEPPVAEPFALDVPKEEMLQPGMPSRLQRVPMPGAPTATPIGRNRTNLAPTLRPDTILTWVGGAAARAAMEQAFDATTGAGVLARSGTDDGRALDMTFGPERIANDRTVTQKGIGTPVFVHKGRLFDQRGTGRAS